MYVRARTTMRFGNSRIWKPNRPTSRTLNVALLPPASSVRPRTTEYAGPNETCATDFPTIRWRIRKSNGVYFNNSLETYAKIHTQDHRLDFVTRKESPVFNSGWARELLLFTLFRNYDSFQSFTTKSVFFCFTFNKIRSLSCIKKPRYRRLLSLYTYSDLLYRKIKLNTELTLT